jgi:hypothetical protein
MMTLEVLRTAMKALYSVGSFLVRPGSAGGS